jgi:hypothetical protein
MNDEEDDVEQGSSESVSSFGEGENPEGGKKNKNADEDYPSELEDSEEE